MKFFRVQILPQNQEHIDETVFAADEKQALLTVIESISITHPCWQAAGWRGVQVFAENRPFIVSKKSSL